MFNVGDRRVKVQTGQKTQTINICSEQNVHGVYDYILRLRPPFVSQEQLISESFASIDELMLYLQQNYSAHIEKSPSKASLSSSLPASSHKLVQTKLPQEESMWHLRAKRIVEASIDEFVLDFVALPCLHRVEHSIHCELFRILKSHTLFASAYPMGEHISQCVHKEWPEYKSRPGKRRGNFDISIIAPDDLNSASYDDFNLGKLRPFAAIELGLNYDLNHLEQDAEKFQNSGIANSYLVHLVRDEMVDNFVELEKFITQSPFKTAYARIAGDRAFYKLVNDTDILETSR